MIDANLDLLENVLDCMVDLKDSPNRLSSMKDSELEELLSDLEWKVLIAYLDGKSYQEIAVELHRHVKSIDNALQRVKRKLEKYVDGHGNIDIKGSMSDFGSVGKYLRDMY